MSNRERDLIARQNNIWQQMQELQSRSEAENRDWTAEERANWDTAHGDLEIVSGDLDRIREMAKLDSVDYSRALDVTGHDVVETPERRAEQREADYGRAFGAFMRGGMDKLDLEQRQLLLANATDDPEVRAQGVASGAVGGFLVPPGYRAIMQQTMKAYGGLINHANVITTSTGNPLQWPTNDDTANIGAILTENTQITQQDVALGTRTLGAYVYTSKLVLVALQLLQDSAFDLNTWLPERLGIRIGRATAAHFISGTGTGQPLGIASAPTVGKTGLVGQTLTVIYDDLVDLEHSIDPAYRAMPDVRYLMHDATLKVIRKLKDTQNRPLWVPVPTVGMAATINGWPYTVDQGMPIPAANAYSILFGDFKAGYIIRQVMDMQAVRLSERYMDFLQVGFFGFVRLDARPDDPAAVRAYQQSAT